MKKIIILIAFISIISCSQSITENVSEEKKSEEIFWEQTSAIDKRVDVLTIDSKDNILVGAANGRIYRSTDNGKSWVYINSKLLSLIFHVNSIAINSKGHIFFSDGQIYRSSDQGMSWMEVSNNKVRANYLLISPEDEIYAISCCGWESSGVYRSIDDGVSWTKPDSVIKSFSPYSLSLNSKGHLFAISNVGVFISLDKANTWRKIKDGYTYALTIDNNDELFIVSGYAQSKTLFKSTDNGINWERISDVAITDLVINSKGIMYGINGTIGMVRSVDGGKSWQEINSGLMQIFARRVAINSRGFIFAGTASYDKYSQLEKGEVFKSIKSTLE